MKMKDLLFHKLNSNNAHIESFTAILYIVYQKKYMIDSVVAYPFMAWDEYVWSDYDERAEYLPYQYDIVQYNDDDKSWMIYETVSS